MHWGWAYDGVNGSIPRNTGYECVNYLSKTRHIAESFILIPVAILIFKYGMSKLPPLQISYSGTDRIVFGKQLLLITMTFLLGLEMGFKLCTRSAIYILNPCHVTSMLQVYLLAAKPSKWTTTLFRIHINYLNGPLLAFLFPEHESRRITFELCTYYIQHGLMFVIPAYLLRSGGPYAAEKLTDFSYSIAAYGIFIFYHYGILEFFAVSAQVNLNHMICPAILDPFQGANYRLIACMHQMLLCPIVSKFFGYMFSSTSNETAGAHQKGSSQNDVHDIKLENSTLHRQEVKDTQSVHVQNMAHDILKDRNNGSAHTNTIWSKTMMTTTAAATEASHNESNAKNVNGKQIENGCDIGNSTLSDASIQCPNDSNKKTK